MATTDAYRPRPIRVRSLCIGQWVQSKTDPLDMAQIKNVYRHEKRVQLIRDTSSRPFSVTFADLTRDYRSIAG